MAKTLSSSTPKAQARPASRTRAQADLPRLKSDQIIQLLKQTNGASVPELMKVTGWQAHSVRGFISGTVKKKLGLEVQTRAEGGQDRRYVIGGGA